MLRWTLNPEDILPKTPSVLVPSESDYPIYIFPLETPLYLLKDPIGYYTTNEQGRNEYRRLCRIYDALHRKKCRHPLNGPLDIELFRAMLKDKQNSESLNESFLLNRFFGATPETRERFFKESNATGMLHWTLDPEEVFARPLELPGESSKKPTHRLPATAAAEEKSPYDTSQNPPEGLAQKASTEFSVALKIFKLDPEFARREFDANTLKSAYRRFILQWHPDKNPEPHAAEWFKVIDGAYKRLNIFLEERR